MNEKEQGKLLFNYFLYFACFIFVCFIGVSHIFAAEHNMGNWSNYTEVLLEIPGAGAPIGLNRDTYNVAGNFTQVYVNVGNISINKDYIYQLEISTPGSNFTNVNYVLVTQIVGNNGVNQSCNMLGFSDANIGYPKIYFQCASSFSNGNMTFTLYNINGADLVSEPQYFKWGYTNFRYYDDVNEIDWGPVTSNATQNTQNIINNDNQNTQNIINNQNSNTDREIESQKVCDTHIITKDDVYLNNTILRADDITSDSTGWGVTNYIDISGLVYFKVLSVYEFNTGANICFYTSTKSLVSCQNIGFLSGTLSIPDNVKYFRSSILISSNKPNYEYENCQNGNQALSDNINSLTGALTDDSSTDVSSLGNTVGWLPPGPLDSIINLPLNFMNGFVTALSGSCRPLRIPIPFVNSTLTIPCLIQYLEANIPGIDDFFDWFGWIISALIMYKYLINLYKYYDDLTTLKANFISDFGGAP